MKSRVQGSHSRKPTNISDSTRLDSMKRERNVHNPRIATLARSLALEQKRCWWSTILGETLLLHLSFFLPISFFQFFVCLFFLLFYSFCLLGLFSRKQKDWFIIILTYNDALLRCWSLLSFFLDVINWLVGWLVPCSASFLLCFPFFFVLRQTFALYIFPPSQYRIESLVATQDNVSWCTSEDETWKTEHWTAIKEPPTLGRTLRHLRYLWSCYWREARVITMRVYNPFLAVRLHHSFVSFYPFLQNLFLPSRILSLSLSLSFLLFLLFLLLYLLSRLVLVFYAAICCNYQVAGRHGTTWFSFSIAPTQWLKEKFERCVVSNAACSLACRKPKCLSNKPITSSKRQNPIFIASQVPSPEK